MLVNMFVWFRPQQKSDYFPLNENKMQKFAFQLKYGNSNIRQNKHEMILFMFHSAPVLSNPIRLLPLGITPTWVPCVPLRILRNLMFDTSADAKLWCQSQFRRRFACNVQSHITSETIVRKKSGSNKIKQLFCQTSIPPRRFKQEQRGGTRVPTSASMHLLR